MKKTLLVSSLLLAFATPALAQPYAPGIDLHWNDCVLGSSAATDIAWDCNNNAPGIAVSMTASFVPPGTLPLYEANLCVIDLQTSAAILSPWWHMETPSPCPNRAGRIVTSATWATSACRDFWGGLAQTAQLYVVPSPLALTPNSARVKAVAGVAQTYAGPVSDQDPSTNPPTPLVWYALNVNILRPGTLPPTVCAGCTDGACFVLNEMILSQPAPTVDVRLSAPCGAPGAQNWVTYRGGAATHGGQCPNDPPLPVRSLTWGSIKALYR